MPGCYGHFQFALDYLHQISPVKSIPSGSTRHCRSPSERAVGHRLAGSEWQHDAPREIMTQPDPPERPIGFINPEDKGKKAQAKR